MIFLTVDLPDGKHEAAVFSCGAVVLHKAEKNLSIPFRTLADFCDSFKDCTILWGSGSSAAERGHLEAYQDRCEGVMGRCVSVPGHAGKLLTPKYIPEAEVAGWRLGYELWLELNWPRWREEADEMISGPSDFAEYAGGDTGKA